MWVCESLSLFSHHEAISVSQSHPSPLDHIYKNTQYTPKTQKTDPQSIFQIHKTVKSQDPKHHTTQKWRPKIGRNHNSKREERTPKKAHTNAERPNEPSFHRTPTNPSRRPDHSPTEPPNSPNKNPGHPKTSKPKSIP